MKKYVIIGGGYAGVRAIEGIRSVDNEGEITLVSAESSSCYSRPLISYYLEGRTDLAHIGYREADFYEKRGVTAIHGVSADSLDPALKTVLLSDGSSLPYDSLLIATGSGPFVPPFEGLDTVKNKFGFMTLSDALSLEKAIDAGSRVLIVGAGLIGLKCAEGIKERVRSVTVCDLAPHALSSILTPDSAEVVENLLRASGLTLMLGDTVQRFEGGKAHMKSGETVDFDVLVLAVGVRPNTALVRAAGGSVNRGVIVNARMETSLPDIYAAGDCAESAGGITAIIPSASMGGFAAGVNMAGGELPFDGSPKLNSMGLFGLHIMTAGSYEGEALGTPERRFFIKDGALSGFILLGDTARAGVYTGLIREKTPLSTIDFGAIMECPSLLPFGAEYRKEKLGGVV